ncbi:MAG: glycosyltransferase [Candidatus Aminicenantes bacterium]|jgi:glycosyltransferase involved in cell wall biosynthesis
MPNNTDDPKLSVIVASYNSRTTIEKCLRSLFRQKTSQTYEVIVVDSSQDGTGDLIKSKFPEVRLYAFPERKYVGTARNLGIELARGDIIALTDADCTASETWIEEIFKSHRSPHPAVGGAIANGNPKNYVGWAAYFCEFSAWIPSQRSGWKMDIAGANMSYKRELFEEFGKFIVGTYCSDTEFHWRLHKRGLRLRFEPSILVNHQNIEHFGRLMRHEYLHGKNFATVRVKAKHFSKTKRFVYVVLSPLLPIKLFLERGIKTLRRPSYLFHFLLSSPLLFLALLSWSLGEVFGYVRGYDDARNSEAANS